MISSTSMASQDVTDYLDKLDNKRVVIWFSGWPDSVATYEFTRSYYQSKWWETNQIFLAHYNHNMRQESIQESDYIQSHYTNVIVGIYHWDSKKESELRNARHTFFRETLTECKTNTLLLGHNLTDRIETTMLNIQRWSNITGKVNMRHVDNKEWFVILRPLLSLPKKAIEEHCSKSGFSYFIDHSNSDPSISNRNLIRSTMNNKNPIELAEYLQQWFEVPLISSTMRATINTLYKERESKVDTHKFTLFSNSIPPCFGCDILYNIPNTLSMDQLARLLKHIQEYHEVTTSYLEDLYRFIQSWKQGSKQIGTRVLAKCHGVCYLYKTNKQFDSWQVLDFWLSYGNLKKQTTRIIDLYWDRYAKKPINKYLINQKIPLFFRKALPVIQHNDWNLDFVSWITLIKKLLNDWFYVNI